MCHTFQINTYIEIFLHTFICYFVSVRSLKPLLNTLKFVKSWNISSGMNNLQSCWISGCFFFFFLDIWKWGIFSPHTSSSSLYPVSADNRTPSPSTHSCQLRKERTLMFFWKLIAQSGKMNHQKLPVLSRQEWTRRNRKSLVCKRGQLKRVVYQDISDVNCSCLAMHQEQRFNNHIYLACS